MGKNVFISGGAGVGKSVLLGHVIHSLVEKWGKVVEDKNESMQ